MARTQINLTKEDLQRIIIDSKTIREIKILDRPDYYSWLTESLDSKFIKVITGFRRTGKSFLLKQLSLDLKKQGTPEENILFLNFEHFLLSRYNQVEELNAIYEFYKQTIYQGGEIYMILDEIQNINLWEKFVRTIYESDLQNHNIFLTGSNSSLLSSEFTTALSGRNIEMQINPFSFEEYLKYYDLWPETDFEKVTNKNEIITKLNEYLKTGGLPEIVDEGKENKYKYLQSVFQKVLLDDILKRFDIDRPEIIEDLFKFIANALTSPISFSSITNEINKFEDKITIPTLKNYAKIYESVFAINKIPKFEWKLKKIFNKQYKYYVFDNGFINLFRETLTDNRDKLLENLVYNYLRLKYKKIYYGRDDKGREVDFIIIDNDEIIKIQVCVKLTQENKTRELGRLALANNYLRNDNNYLISLEDDTEEIVYDDTKIKIINVVDLLLGVVNL